MKIKFESGETVFTAEGANVILAVGNLEEKLKDFTGLPMVLLDDLPTDFNEMIEDLNHGATYRRSDFSDPDNNYSVEVLDNL
jgi:hypothetical protein